MDLLKKEIERKRKAVALAKESASEVSQGINSQACNKPETGAAEATKKNKTFMRAVDVRKFEEKLHRESIQQNKVIAPTAQSIQQSSSPTILATNDDTSSNYKSAAAPAAAAAAGAAAAAVCFDETTVTTSVPETLSQSLNHTESYQKNPYADIQHLTTDEITRELRELGLPIWVFGERNDHQRRKRLIEAKESIQAMAAGISEMDDFRLGSGHGIRNPFLTSKKTRKEEEDLLGRIGGDTSHQNQHPDNTSKLDSTAAVISIDAATTHVETLKQEQGQQQGEEEEDHHKKIHGFFKSLLRQWEEDLAQRPDSIKRTAAGKNETKTLKQCKDYIRPLLKLCKTRRLEESMLNHILKIVNFCIQGEFVKANDAYMDVAIGRAAWPIGVTMVGIHARSGRARIESSNVAHVMNSEMQRKYLTSVKRLMSYCQKKRTDLPPSKKVLNV